MKKIFKFILFLAILVVLAIAGILIYMSRNNSDTEEDPSSSIWLTKDVQTIPDSFSDSNQAETIDEISEVVNNNVVNATSWYKSAYYYSAGSTLPGNPLLNSNSLSKPVSSIANILQYYNVYLLSSNNDSDVPRAYIVSKPSVNITDPSIKLTQKIQQLRDKINSYSTWTSGTEKLCSELACYNLQKYSYSDTNKLNTLFYKINNYRSNNSLNLLKMDSRLQLYAMERAIEIAWVYDQTGNYTSLGPDGNVSSLLSDYNCEIFCENLAYKGNTVNDVFNIWTNLDFSRNSMLNEDYNYAGIGISEAEDGTLFWVIMYIKK